MSIIKLQTATREHLQLLKYWDTQPHVLQSGIEDWEWDTELGKEYSWQQQYIAYLNKRAIGFLQIMDPQHEPTKYWGDVKEGYRAIDIWIGEVDCLNAGYGTQMMQQAFDMCFAVENVHTILIDPLASNTKAHKFYKKLGFQFVKKRWFDEDFCFVFKLERENYLR